MTSGAAYLGVDIGSSGTRVAALDATGKIRAVARRTRPRRPMVIADLERTLDAERIWSEVAACVSEVAARCGEVRAIGVCAMRQTLVVLDDKEAVLFASGSDDLRASLYGAAIDSAHGDALMRQAGRALAAIYWPGKLAWLEAEAPDDTARARALTTLEGWIVRRLTGADSIGSVSAGETGARSIPKAHWLDAVLPDWTHSLLPPVADDAAAGRLTAQRARDLRLPLGLPVAMCVPDTHAAELGSRTVDFADGDCVTAGWSLTTVRPQAAWDAEAPVWRGLRLGGGYLAESNAGDLASGYAWLSQGGDGELTDLASPTDSAAERGIFATTGARVIDAAAAGLGAAGMVSPMPFAEGVPTRELLATAVLEDMAFAVRGNRERLPPPIADGAPVRLTGGFAAAQAAGPILANVLGAPVAAYPGIPVTAIGAAMCGAAAAGDFTLGEAVAQLAPAPQVHEPDPWATRAYDGHYACWVDLRSRLEAFVQETL
ncbi:MAG: FGGY family carbohydrate kinase [Chloroflexi bacterium]|nr:FGGY family carbohydrate kinase [Chloroflexota bacterium]